MRKLKQIKKQIKSEGEWKKYKNVFRHKQMRLIFSEVALLLNPEINLKFLMDCEISLLSFEKGPKMFVETFKTLNDRVTFKCDWEMFAHFLWFVYQTSTYWKDTKKKKTNIFTKDNYLEVNQQKRDCYQKWIDSIDKENKMFNTYIIEMSRMVF